MGIQLISIDDLFIWPDGTRCFRADYERGHYQQMSDDFEVVPEGSERWRAISGEDEC